MRRVLEPDAKLAKMISFAKVVLLFNIIIAFLRIVIGAYSDMFSDLICSLILMMACFTIYFLYMAIYEIFCLLNAVTLALGIGLRIQKIIQDNQSDGTITLYLCISSVIFVFYVSAILFTYPMYKEMRAQAMESIGSFYRASAANNQPQPDPEVPANNRGGFVAFSGRGHAVGG